MPTDLPDSSPEAVEAEMIAADKEYQQRMTVIRQEQASLFKSIVERIDRRDIDALKKMLGIS